MNFNEALVSIQDITKAQEVISDHIHKTPLIQNIKISELLNINLHFKAELFQKMGSFKIRGVLNKLHSLTREEKSRGVITISAGNHAQSPL